MTIDEIALRLSGVISSEYFATGERAELRRWTQNQTPPLCYYRLAAEYVPLDIRHNDKRWMTYCHCIAMLADLDPSNISIGAALRGAEFSERRLARLLASSEFVDDLDRVVKWLVAKQQPVSVVELFRAIYYDGSDFSREKIARDFYNSSAQKE
jgi:CRISPR type I-E-associated protein CasB/Cse2